MKIGTKSLLFGVHQFLLHPMYMALAWYLLRGLPLDPRLWMAFLVHDWGYWGCETMDGHDGANHPDLGATIMGALLGEQWASFTRYHSRTTARRDGVEPSPLCGPDKLANVLVPKKLYLALARATGEIREYMERWADFAHVPVWSLSQDEWYERVMQRLHSQAIACNAKSNGSYFNCLTEHDIML